MPVLLARRSRNRNIWAQARRICRPRFRRRSNSSPGVFSTTGRGGDRRAAPRSDRGERSGSGSNAPRRFSPSPQGDRPDRSERPSGGAFASRKPFTSRPPSGERFGGKPRSSRDSFSGNSHDRQERSASTESGKRVYRKFDAPRDRPARAGDSDGDKRKPAGDFTPRKFAGKPGGFAGKKSSAKSDRPFTGKSTSTFAKFAGNKKPFGKRAPARKFKPSQGESA